MSVSIKRDRATGKNLGYGFVKMSSHQEARIAKDAMQARDAFDYTVLCYIAFEMCIMYSLSASMIVGLPSDMIPCSTETLRYNGSLEMFLSRVFELSA